MNLQHRLAPRLFAECRGNAVVGDSAPSAARNRIHASAQIKLHPLEAQIHRRISEPQAFALALEDFSLYRPRTAQHRCRILDLARLKRGTDSCGRYALAFIDCIRHDFDFDPMSLEKRRITSTASPEPPVLAAVDDAVASGVAKLPLDAFLGRHVGQLGSEVERNDLADPAAPYRL